jgi:hypothetical protein
LPGAVRNRPHIDGMVLREAHYSSQRQFYFNTSSKMAIGGE